jgi:hypothetical protein
VCVSAHCTLYSDACFNKTNHYSSKIKIKIKKAKHYYISPLSFQAITAVHNAILFPPFDPSFFNKQITSPLYSFLNDEVF